MSRALPWLLLFLAVAATAHLVTIVLTPRVLMGVAMHRLGNAGVNRIVHAPRADETQRVVVMPSPDFLYSYCVYDLAQGALHLSARVPSGSYWSVSLYDAKTDNFFAADDRTPEHGELDLLLVPASAELPDDATGTRLVRSPSRRGIVLFRSLIDRDERLPELDSLRRQARCEAQPFS
jgi:uncharacterized membrane protein